MAMEKPFQHIVDTDPLCLIYGVNRDGRKYLVDIVDCITKTFAQYGEGVSEREFNNVIQILTKGRIHHTILHRIPNQNIVIQLCKLFPSKLNTKNVDKIISNIYKPVYTQECIEAINNSGYVFTETQIKKLNKLGYAMHNVVTTMTYEEFISLFDNEDFKNKFKSGLNCPRNTSCNPKNYENLINEKIKIIQDLCDKFKFIIKPDFIEIVMQKIVGSVDMSIHDVLNLHKIAKALDMKFESEKLKNIILNFTSFYLKTDKHLLKEIIDYYDNPITRDFILQNLDHPNIFKTFLNKLFTSYDPIEDIFYILYKTYRLTLHDYIQHMIDNTYLVYDDFLLLLMYSRIESSSSKMVNILEKYLEYNKDINYLYIENIFTFGNYTSINALSDYKILPTVSFIKMNIGLWNLSDIKKKSLFIDDEIEEFIDKIMLYDVDGGGCDYYVEDNYRLSESQIIRIYDSLDDDDKQIIIRLPDNEITSVASIVRYRIKVSKDMIECMLLCNAWTDIISLLFLDKTYDYIIQMLDINTIMIAPTYYARIWMLENIYNESRETFALPNKFYDMQYHISDDIRALLKMPIIHDIDKYRQKIHHDAEIERHAYVSKQIKDCTDSDNEDKYSDYD